MRARQEKAGEMVLCESDYNAATHLRLSNFRLLRFPVSHVLYRTEIRRIYEARAVHLNPAVRSFIRRFLSGVHRIIVLPLIGYLLLFGFDICK